MPLKSTSHLIAHTHPPEYRLHKYWARKPHNILAHVISQYTEVGDLIVDPFCGSGVLLAESAAQGRRFLGYDLNPISVLLSKVTVNPPSTKESEKTIQAILERVDAKYFNQYRITWEDKTRIIKYCVHATQIRCNHCNKLETSLSARKEGRRYICSNCNKRLYFNLENLVGSEVVQIVFTEGESLHRKDASKPLIELLNNQSKISSASEALDEELFETYNTTFLENRRILAFKDMKVSDLFSKRAFRIICDLANHIHSIDDSRTRDGLLLFLTSSMIQFSRLIAYRNNLSSGGPAWTVPGFWIPPLHLELNPLIYLRSRQLKYTKGLTQLNKKLNNKRQNGTIELKPAQQAFNELANEKIKPNLIFLDPPYGDNVPYLEFSTVWNSILKQPINFEQEIIVSDRKEKVSNWNKYSQQLADILHKCKDLLIDSGHLVITFNNLEPQAWHALLQALQSVGFACKKVWYQVPAVISTKAQFAPKTSYIGDFYCVYTINPSMIQKSLDTNLHHIHTSILQTLWARNGTAAKNIVLRAAVTEVLKQNLAADVILKLDTIIEEFAVQTNSHYTLKEEFSSKTESSAVPKIAELIEKAALRKLSKKECTWKELLEEIFEATDSVGLPTVYEIRQALDNKVHITSKKCSLRSEYVQPKLF